MSLDECPYKVPSQKKMFNLLAVANMSKENTLRVCWGGVHPVPQKPPFTYLKKIILITMARNVMYIAERSLKKVLKWGVFIDGG